MSLELECSILCPQEENSGLEGTPDKTIWLDSSSSTQTNVWAEKSIHGS